MNKVELVGIIASLLIIASMSCTTRTYKGALTMRIINIIGSVVFVIYGALLPAFSTAFLNAVLVVVNVYHTYMLVKENK